MGFSLTDGIVEGNLFNRRAEGHSGKWKYTIALDMRGVWDHPGGSVDAVLAAWRAGMFEGVVASLADGDGTAPDGYYLVVMEPFVKGGGYPVMVAV